MRHFCSTFTPVPRIVSGLTSPRLAGCVSGSPDAGQEKKKLEKKTSVNELPLLRGVQNVAEELAGSGSLVSQPFQYVAVLRAVLGNQSSHRPLKLERVVHHRKGRHLVRRHPILDAATVEEPQVQLLRCSPVGVRLCQHGVPRNSSKMRNRVGPR